MASTSPEVRSSMRRAGMDAAKRNFEAGNRYALFEAILLATAGREPLPDWAREPLWRIERELGRGELADLNEAFGWQRAGEFNKNTRMSEARYRRFAQEIFVQLAEARRQGKGMTPVTFEAIAETVGRGVGRSLVQRVWIRRRAELLRIQAGSRPGGHVHVVLDYWDQ